MRTAVLIAAAALTFAAGARAQEEDPPAEATADAGAVAAAERSCVNEISLFCKGESGAALLDCLSAYRGSATPRCRAALPDDPTAPSAKVWASPAAAAPPGSAPVPKNLGPAPGAGASGPGFDFAMTEQTKSYAVGPGRIKELVDQLGGSGLKDEDGATGAAQTASAVTYAYASGPRDGGCTVASAHVRLALTQTLPKRADDAASVDPGWRRAEAVLRVHADGHKKAAMRAAQEFLHRLQRLHTLPTCADVDGAVQTLYRRERLDTRQHDAEYDAETAHGRAQWDQQAVAAGGRAKP